MQSWEIKKRLRKLIRKGNGWFIYQSLMLVAPIPSKFTKKGNQVKV